LIRESRKARLLTQAQLATSIGVSRRWVVQVEQGKTSPDLRMLLRALLALGLEMSVRPRRESPAAREISHIVNSTKRRAE